MTYVLVASVILVVVCCCVALSRADLHRLLRPRAAAGDASARTSTCSRAPLKRPTGRVQLDGTALAS
eukprot:184705-Prymnesium_polylepis.1